MAKGQGQLPRRLPERASLRGSHAWSRPLREAFCEASLHAGSGSCHAADVSRKALHSSRAFGGRDSRTGTAFGVIARVPAPEGAMPASGPMRKRAMKPVSMLAVNVATPCMVCESCSQLPTDMLTHSGLVSCNHECSGAKSAARTPGRHLGKILSTRHLHTTIAGMHLLSNRFCPRSDTSRCQLQHWPHLQPIKLSAQRPELKQPDRQTTVSLLQALRKTLQSPSQPRYLTQDQGPPPATLLCLDPR